jgi:hypothetical protein
LKNDQVMQNFHFAFAARSKYTLAGSLFLYVHSSGGHVLGIRAVQIGCEIEPFGGFYWINCGWEGSSVMRWGSAIQPAFAWVQEHPGFHPGSGVSTFSESKRMMSHEENLFGVFCFVSGHDFSRATPSPEIIGLYRLRKNPGKKHTSGAKARRILNHLRHD